MLFIGYYLFELQIRFFPGGNGTTIRHSIQIHISHKITRHAQIKHSISSYTNSKGRIKHNLSNEKDGKVSLQQAVKVYKVVKRRESNIF
jgi:hypothetical protein